MSPIMTKKMGTASRQQRKSSKRPVVGAAKRLFAQEEGPMQWPVKCICNLCQCGGHRCSNFSLDEQAAIRFVRRANSSAMNDQDSTIGGANMEDGLSDATSLSSPPPPATSLGRHKRVAGCQHHNNLACNYNNNDNSGCMMAEASERYLPYTRASPTVAAAAAAAPSERAINANNSGVSSVKRHGDANYNHDNDQKQQQQQHNFDEDMLHLLVTRPAIASKPKDHILFEGEMDLKTTFETSYEALAKMRLNAWRQLQELADSKQQQQQRRQAGRGHTQQGEEVERDEDDDEEDGDGDGEEVSYVDNSMNRTAQASPARAATGPAATGTKSTIGKASTRAIGQGCREHKRNRIVKRATGFRQHQQQEQQQQQQQQQLQLDPNEADEDQDGHTQVGDLNYDERHHLNTAASRTRSPPIGADDGEEQFNYQGSVSPFLQRDQAAPANPLVSSSSPISRIKRSSPTPVAPSPIHQSKPYQEQQQQQQQQQPGLTPSPSEQQLIRLAGAGATSQQKQIPTHKQQHQQQHQQQSGEIKTNDNNNNTFIDPDLSPIIVYDANMNRLERVGIRRRSKYRPSTSLRLGARGLFGDCDTSGGAAPNSSAKQENVITPAMDKVDGRQTPGGGEPRTAAGATSKELDRFRDLDLSGKKHLLGHSGRIDHIRQQNVADQEADDKLLKDSATLIKQVGRESPVAPAAATTTTITNTTAAGATSKELNRFNDVDVTCKKHLLGHSGRIDHIREQEIADQKADNRHFENRSTPTEQIGHGKSAFSSNTTAAGASSKELGRSRNMDISGRKHLLASSGRIDHIRDQDLADAERRLVEDEESAAVAEIQRCTRSVNESAAHEFGQRQASATPNQQQFATSNGVNRLQSAGANVNLDSRQLRQRRVCQNQSFFINENEYPDAKGALNDEYCIKIGGRESAELLLSISKTTTPVTGPVLDREQQASGVYGRNLRLDKGKNLFRESPDFIPITGGDSNKQQQQQQKPAAGLASVAREADNKETSVNGNYKAHGACPLASNSSCRVLNLDHDFEFVGSRSGHKYFVEKQAETEQPLLTD